MHRRGWNMLLTGSKVHIYVITSTDMELLAIKGLPLQLHSAWPCTYSYFPYIITPWYECKNWLSAFKSSRSIFLWWLIWFSTKGNARRLVSEMSLFQPVSCSYINEIVFICLLAAWAQILPSIYGCWVVGGMWAKVRGIRPNAQPEEKY